ncbi:MAG TPA: cobalt ECF transporter T component CbiQ [Deltaproteobacteria bacterium]|nr:cobalt ECF transporter T component CbiQ [Deltaproteobacteria bacterium]
MDHEQIQGPEGLLHALDARIKLVCVALISAVVALLSSVSALMIALFFSLVLIIGARLPLRVLVVRILAFNLFIAFLWLFLPWTLPGKEVYRIGIFSMSAEGVHFMTGITLRSNALVLMLMAWMATTPIVATTRALKALHVPDKLMYLFFFTYRYIQEISNEYTRLVTAMRIRCFRPRTDLHTYRSYAYLVGMLLVNSFERSLRIRYAMLCRGFQGHFPRLASENISRLDVVSLIVVCLVLVGIIYVEG